MKSMKTKLSWRKGLFSNLYRIYSNGQFVGTLRNRPSSRIASGELYGKKYQFKSKGVFNQVTELIDDENQRIGQISYNNWKTKAKISAFNKEIFWKYDNIWNTKWCIYNSDGMEIRYAGSSSNGTIESNTNNPLLLLSGLFVVNYYRQAALAVLIIIFIPLFAG